MEKLIAIIILIALVYVVIRTKLSSEQKPVQIHDKCPRCGSTRFHAFVENVVVREGKVKSKTTLNINPLKPFTVFNHKEKVVRQPSMKQVSKFVCDNCGNIFQ